MDYQVLARKWRPLNFKDMVGQEHILRMLTNALEQKRIHHAWLLTGTRGVGKTTLARILAKCLNCETGITSTPCGECHACRAVDSGQFLDLYEVDAASRTKVEDTRELLDNVLYPPTQGRYKIYLIDEVHMLSNHSFNALLKTLEEPPEHVKFLLATTDPKKLPVTILSRCLQFHLKHISTDQIARHLQHVCKAEAIEHEQAGLEKLAKAAAGSMRDALSLLDQAIAYGQGAIKINDVLAMLGCTTQNDLLPLLQALADQDGSKLFTLMAELGERDIDFQQVLEECINIFHHLAIIQIVPDALSTEESLKPFVNCFTAEEIQLYYQIALLGRRDLPLASSPQQGFEMTMLRMLAFKPGMQNQTTIPQPDSIAEMKPTNMTPLPEKNTDIPAEANTSVLATNVSVQENHTSQWREILPMLELSGMAYALAANCSLDSVNGDKVTLALSVKHQPMLNPKLKERLAEALGRYYKQEIQLDIRVTDTELNTPLKQEQSAQIQQLNAAKQSIMENSQIKTLLEMYDATVEVSLV